MSEERKIAQIWVLEPTWQNFSSMYREAICAQEATTGMEVSHHRMAVLYFGIAALECFINREMTLRDSSLGLDHEDINKKLRNPKAPLKVKLRTWPEEITGKPLRLRPETMQRILAINDLRGQLTHVKNYWPDIFDELRRIDSMEVVDLVAEYIIAFYQAKGDVFPYWVLGWNYLNPGLAGYDIVLLPYTQFFHSLNSLGYKLECGRPYSGEAYEQEVLSDFSGFRKVAAFLRSKDRCEPKWDRAPHQPKLCRRWWDASHQQSCGAVTQGALDRAFQIDEEYAARAVAMKGVRVRQSASFPSQPYSIRSWLKRWLPPRL